MIWHNIAKPRLPELSLLALVILIGIPSIVHAQNKSQATPAPINIKGLWEDSGHEIRVIQSGNDVTALYLEPYICNHRDGTGKTDQTDLDFSATLNGDTLIGQISVCGWGAGNKYGVGIRPTQLTLTVSEDGMTMDGTWYNQNDDKDEAMSITRLGECPLTTFTGKNFDGKAVSVDKGFIPALKKIDDYAGKNKVTVNVQASFRAENATLSGTIVPPVQQSNHLAGHAIDMNVEYTDSNGKQQLCNSSCLGGSDLPDNVQNFINDIKNDPDLRWGGDFSTPGPDPVHIDDGLNVKNADLWQETYDEVQANQNCNKASP